MANKSEKLSKLSTYKTFFFLLIICTNPQKLKMNIENKNMPSMTSKQKKK